MKDLDLSQFPNSTGWEVVHDGDTNMYYLANKHGNRKAGLFTTRVLATVELYNYLNRIAASQIKVEEGKRRKTA